MKIVKSDFEIRNRILLTLFVVFIYHLGTFIPISGIDTKFLYEAAKTNLNLAQLLNTSSGGGFLRFGLLTLGILPYINASLILQVLTNIFPQLKALQKEQGEVGRQKLYFLTRLLTILVSIVQSISLLETLKPFIFDFNFELEFNITLNLVTGAMISFWLSEIINEKGLGNGSSIFIILNILCSIPEVLFENIKNNQISLIELLQTSCLFYLALIGIIFLQEAIRFIPIISARQLNSKLSLPRSNVFIPFKMNTSGVLPIVIASTALIFFSTFTNFLLGNKKFLFIEKIPILLQNLGSNIFFFVLIIFSASFYATIILNPNDIADDLKQSTTTIVGVRPGEDTVAYLEETLFRINLLGGIILAFLIFLPNLGELFLGIQSLKNFGITSLIILAGTIIDIVQELRSISLSKKK